MNTWKPVVSRKAYRTGGQVDDLGDQVTNLKSPMRQFEVAQRAADRDAKWSKGHVLSQSQKDRKRQDAADLAGLGEAALLDLTGGGQVEGGPPGKDTIPVVSAPGGPTEAMLDNEEYVLPAATTELLGKPNLDNLVKRTTGRAPVGDESMGFEPMKFGMGGFFDRFRNRGKQINDAVDAATNPEVAAVEPPAPKSTSMRDIMREIRKKNPPRKEKVRGYANGGSVAYGDAQRRKHEERLAFIKDLPDPDRAEIILKRNALKNSESAQRGFPNSAREFGQAIREGSSEFFGPAIEGVTSAVKLPLAVGSDFSEGLLGLDPTDPTPTPTQAQMLAEQEEGVYDVVSTKSPTVPAPQEPIIRKASPDDLVPMGDAAFSPENVARARSEAQTFEANNPLSQARTAADINADTAAIRGLRNARRDAEGSPRVGEVRGQARQGSAPISIRDQISLANLQRGLANDQQQVGQDRFRNELSLLGERREQGDAANAAQDRYMEQSETLIPEVTTQLPWMGDSVGPFFQRASEISSNPRQAANLLVGAVQNLETNKEELFELAGQSVTGVEAIQLLNGETPFGSWGFGPDEDAYDALRRRALQEVQTKALEGFDQ